MIEIPPKSGVGFVLEEGQRLKVVDPEGGQVADLFCVDAENPRDALSSGRTIDYAETVRLTRGHPLYSNSGNILLRITHDTCGVHDFLVTPCSRQMFRMMFGKATHDGCFENLSKALAPFDVPPTTITTTFNVFMNVPVDPDGRIRVLPPVSKPGDYVIFEAQRRVFVGLTACADEGSNGGRCKKIQYSVT